MHLLSMSQVNGIYERMASPSDAETVRCVILSCFAATLAIGTDDISEASVSAD